MRMASIVVVSEPVNSSYFTRKCLFKIGLMTWWEQHHSGVLLTALLTSVGAEFVAPPAARTGRVFAAATTPFSIKDPSN